MPVMYRSIGNAVICAMIIKTLLCHAAPMNGNNVPTSLVPHHSQHSKSLPWHYTHAHEIYEQGNQQTNHHANVAGHSQVPAASHHSVDKSTTTSALSAAALAQEGHGGNPLRKKESNRFQMRKAKAKVLLVHANSAVPMFTQGLSAEQVKKHSELDNWHIHREALRRGDIQQEHLPPLLQPLKGRYRFVPKEDAGEGQRSRTEEQERNKVYTDTRRAKLAELGLHRNSPVPTFVHQLNLEQIKEHPFIDEWHQYRNMIEKGQLKAENLPLHLSNISGELLFNTPKEKSKLSTAKLTREQKIKMNKANGFAKTKELKLHRNSAIPIFAQKLTAEEIKHHEDIHDWHHYRHLLEEGHITQQEMPLSYQPPRGMLRNHRKGLKVKSKSTAHDGKKVVKQGHGIDQAATSSKAQQDTSSASGKDRTPSQGLGEESDHNPDSDQELWDLIHSQLDWNIR